MEDLQIIAQPHHCLHSITTDPRSLFTLIHTWCCAKLFHIHALSTCRQSLHTLLVALLILFLSTPITRYYFTCPSTSFSSPFLWIRSQEEVVAARDGGQTNWNECEESYRCLQCEHNELCPLQLYDYNKTATTLPLLLLLLSQPPLTDVDNDSFAFPLSV